MPAFNRLLKFVIVAAVLMLAVKLGAVWHDAGVAFAQGAKPADAAKMAPRPSMEAVIAVRSPRATPATMAAAGFRPGPSA